MDSAPQFVKDHVDRRGTQVCVNLGLGETLPLCLQCRQNQTAPECRGSPGAEATRIRALVWKVWGCSCAPSKDRGRRACNLCVTLSLSSRMKMKISFCCHVRQEVCALGSHYHQMYFVSISFTSHLFSLRTHCLDCAANRPFALLSLKHYIPIRKKKKKKLNKLNVLKTFKFLLNSILSYL